MTETITDGPGPRHVFAPHPDPVEGMLHRIYIIFEESDGRLWASGTDMMTPSLESAEVFSDRINETLGVDRAAWPALANRVFAGAGARDSRSRLISPQPKQRSMTPGFRRSRQRAARVMQGRRRADRRGGCAGAGAMLPPY